MNSMIKPVNHYLASAMKANFGVGWNAVWAAPGQIPRLVMEGSHPAVYVSREDAETMAHRVLIEALNKKTLPMWKGSREFMTHQQVRDGISRVPMSFLDLSLTLGQRPERMAQMAKGVINAPFMWWWALEFLQDEDLAEEAREIAFSHTDTRRRAEDGDE